MVLNKCFYDFHSWPVLDQVSKLATSCSSMVHKVKRAKLESPLYHRDLCKNNSDATVVKCCQSLEPAVRTQTICLRTTRVIVCVVERHHYGGKCTFCQSSHEQIKQRGLTVRGNMTVKEKAMWPFYKVRLRMRVLGRNVATPTHACFTCIHPDHILVL